MPSQNIVLTIGGDPEWSLQDHNGNELAARRYVSGGARAIVGTDGDSNTGEMRPRYGTNPRLFSQNVYQTLRTLKNSIPDDVRVIGGSGFRRPTGGHIHFNSNRGGRVVVQRGQQIAHALDQHLMTVLLLLSDRNHWRRRRNSSYGRLSEWRQQSDTHGGIEYRCPPSWLISRGITESILSLSYVIADAAMTNDFGDANWLDRDIYQECRKESLRPRLKEIFGSIQTMPLYDAYKPQVGALYALCRMGRTWQEDLDVLARFDLRDMPSGTIPQQRAPRPQRRDREFLSVPDYPPAPRSNLRFGGDARVSEFVRPLVEGYNGAKTIYIYGSANNRNCDVALVGSVRLLRAYREMGLDVNTATYGSAEEQSEDIRLGISYDIRMNNEDMARRIIQAAITEGGRT